MLTFDYEIKLPNANELIEKYGMKPYGKLQYIVDSTIVEFSDPYTPRDSKTMQDSVVPSIGSGELVYNTPYAHYQWVGVSKNGKPFNYQKKNPLATDHWVIEAMKVHLEDVCRIAEKEIQNGR